MSAVPFIIVPYYCVIGGWVTKYMVGYAVEGPAALADGGDFFSAFTSSGSGEHGVHAGFMALTYLVVAFGREQGH